MDKKTIIRKTVDHVKEKMAGEGSGHDWWHTYRVWRMAVRIGKEEKADLFVVELGALLHDLADWKAHGGDVSVGPRVAREWLESIGTDEETVSHVCHIVGNVSFKGAGVKNGIETKEGMVVQDADRLDAIGAIGVGRVFAYGGYVKREIHDPDTKPVLHKSFKHYRSTTPFKDYKSTNSTSINHFYEKLLLLKKRMNTRTAKRIAEGRHKFMESYLKRFFKEWEGKA